MRTRISVEPQQGATYEDLLAAARAAERCGFEGFFTSDHLLHFAGDGRPGPTDAWITLAGLARETERIRLGTLVGAATFRHPGPLAVAVAQVDAMSGGRVELGLGTGWYAAEHVAFGVPFPSLAERFERLEEQLAVLTGLWRTPEGERFSFAGRHYRLEANPALARPAQRPHPPIIIGGHGARRTPALAARYADEFNVAFPSVAEYAAQVERVREACARAGRPSPPVFSVALTVCCGRSRAELAARRERMGPALEVLRDHALVGTPATVADALAAYADAGAQLAYLQVLDLSDLGHLELLAEEVASRLVPERGAVSHRAAPASAPGA
ncbi:MAG TPA: LLM class F420-dependent oxidoreductase [Acidimicrobiales bacterium]|nr:LLM class F420-dependent oxidoreductase [Acidimicrobiales bacterium]